MKKIIVFEKTGAFAENKDIAQEIRTKEIIPALENRDEVILDFDRVDAATQSFVHALISGVIRKYGHEILDRITFKSCNETIKKIVGIVFDYMQE
jgi:hypothetical protein